jgi:phosphotransferase system enzyme I (PtsP)
MAEPIGAQERLDKIVRLIAANMVAEVCSVYVLRSDNVLELYATEGLKASAVHRATLTVGRGLVGLIAEDARPLNLPDAQSHPAFAYLPETGEEIYHSFLGVPILRAGRTLGVLVVQNRSYRTYVEEEIEALQTTAMVLAEMFASGEMEDLSSPGADLDLNRAVHIKGAPFAEGIALGHVVLHEPRIVVTQLIAEDVEHELKRLDASMASLRLSVDDLLARGAEAGTGEHREILEAYKMFAEDRGWTRRLQEVDRQWAHGRGGGGESAERHRARMTRQTDPFCATGLHDFDDLANRLLPRTDGRQHGPFAGDLPEDAIIVARNMGPAELLDYDRERVRGPRAGGGGGQQPRPPSWRGRWDPLPSASWMTSFRSPSPATRSSSTAMPARCTCARPSKSRSPTPIRCASAPQAGAVPAAAGRTVGYLGRRRDRVAHECRAAYGHAASGGIRRGRHRPVSAPSCSSWWRRASRG